MVSTRRLFTSFANPGGGLDVLPSESIDSAFFSRRLQQAQKWRDWLAQKDGLDSYRLIAGESDGLPGITSRSFR